MDNLIIEEMVEEINEWVKLSYREYKSEGRTAWYYRTVARINGMCSMLTIATGKRVTWNKNGVTIKDYEIEGKV